MILELRNICKTYDQGKLEVPVLKNVSLSVSEGEYLAIMGPSGSGKTTLMNIIGCLDTPTSGEYLLEGEDLSGQNDAKLSQVRLRSIGFVFQSFYLLSRQSAVENVALPLLYAGVRRRERLETAKAALERVGLGDRLDFKPTQLSGGQCQRVAIARAIVNNPKLLLADEPTGALDTKAGEQVMDIFRKLHEEGVTIVMITHEPEIAAHAERTLHIRDGRLVDAQGNFLAPETVDAIDTPEETAAPQDLISVRDLLADPVPVAPQNQEAPSEEHSQELSLEAETPETAPAGESGAPLVDMPEGLFGETLPEEKSPAEEETAPAGEAGAPLVDMPEGLFGETLPEETPPAEKEAAPVDTRGQENEPAESSRENGTAESSLKEDALPEPLPSAPVSQEDSASEVLDIEAIIPNPEDELLSETFLDAEIAALLDQGQNDDTSFDAGDQFLREAGVDLPEQNPDEPSQQAENPPKAADSPALVARPTKSGAPEQISFDIWAEPEPPAEEPEEPDSPEEPVKEETPVLPGQETLQEAISAHGEEPSETEELPFDTAFDAVDPYEPQEDRAGQFGAPLKTEIDLSNAFGRTASQKPEAPNGETGYQKLVEIDDLGFVGKPSAHGEDDQ